MPVSAADRLAPARAARAAQLLNGKRPREQRGLDETEAVDEDALDVSCSPEQAG